MKVLIDYDLCEGNAVCMKVCPEVFAVGDDEERVIASKRPQDFLCGEDHAVAFSASLRVPKDSQSPFVLLQSSHVLDDGVDPKVLMVFCHHLYQSLPLLAEENEVLGNIEQPLFRARPAENSL